MQENGLTDSIIFIVLFNKYIYVLQTVKSCFPLVFPWKVWITALFCTEKRGKPLVGI